MSDLTGPMANTTLISDSNAAYMVNGFDGGFIGFQTYFEGINVGWVLRDRFQTSAYLLDRKLGTSPRAAFDCFWVRIRRHALWLRFSLPWALLAIWSASVHSAPGPRVVTWDRNGLQTIRSSFSIMRSALYIYNPHRIPNLTTCIRVDGR